MTSISVISLVNNGLVNIESDVQSLCNTEHVVDTSGYTELSITMILATNLLGSPVPHETSTQIRSNIPESISSVTADSVGNVPHQVTTNIVLVSLSLVTCTPLSINCLCSSLCIRVGNNVVANANGLNSIVTQSDTYRRSDPLSDVTLNCRSKSLGEFYIVVILTLIEVNATGCADEYVVEETVSLIRASEGLSLCTLYNLRIYASCSYNANGNCQKEFFHGHLNDLCYSFIVNTRQQR